MVVKNVSADSYNTGYSEYYYRLQVFLLDYRVARQGRGQNRRYSAEGADYHKGAKFYLGNAREIGDKVFRCAGDKIKQE